MDHTFDRFSHPTDDLPEVSSVPASRVALWLRQGYDDLRQTQGVSVAYGALVAAAGLVLILAARGATYLVPTLMGGFLLVAPFAAIVLYALSQQIEAGRPVDPVAASFAWRRNAGSIALFGLMLAVSLIFWERLAAIIFALSFGDTVPSRDHPIADLLFSGHYLPLLSAFFGAGALLAAVAFALSVVTAPMLLDRPVDLISAVLTSLRCCARNPATMALWAVVVAVLMAIGFATFMLGLVFLFPLLGHASWHAYRDLVDHD